MIGSLRFTPYRVVLVVAFIPTLSKLIAHQAGKISIADTLVVLHTIWCFIVIAYHHGIGSSMESGGIRMLEFFGTYLVARVYILSEKDYRGTISYMFFLAILITPFVAIEAVTGVHLIKTLASAASGGHFHSGIEDRFGLSRAFGPFDHPIHLGIFAASMFGIVSLRAFPRKGRPRLRRLPQVAVLASALSSVSSGAVATLMTQIVLLLWNTFSAGIRNRWKIFTALTFAAYMFVDLVSNRSGIKVLLHYLTFSAGTAYNRIIIFQYGIQDVFAHPLIGIGFNPWSKPTWMHSDSMDNFWLLQAVTYGVPGFITIFTPVIIIMAGNWRQENGRIAKLRLGWNISMMGLIIGACTVHFWNSLFVYFALFLGSGHWFLSKRKP
ncbi:hypothetical protein [Thioflavicoccus mobilis]|nr:hypothetical protein [Thioflavicoccus mobilis]